MGAAQQVVIAGENVMVVVVDGADMFQRIHDADMRQWLMLAGFTEGQYLEGALQALNENGFDLPNAWVAPLRGDLIELNVGAGYVAGVVERFQRELVVGLGVAFARRMNCTERTDSQNARTITSMITARKPMTKFISMQNSVCTCTTIWREHSVNAYMNTI